MTIMHGRQGELLFLFLLLFLHGAFATGPYLAGNLFIQLVGFLNVRFALSFQLQRVDVRRIVFQNHVAERNCILVLVQSRKRFRLTIEHLLVARLSLSFAAYTHFQSQRSIAILQASAVVLLLHLNQRAVRVERG